MTLKCLNCQTVFQGTPENGSDNFVCSSCGTINFFYLTTTQEEGLEYRIVWLAKTPEREKILLFPCDNAECIAYGINVNTSPQTATPSSIPCPECGYPRACARMPL